MAPGGCEVYWNLTKVNNDELLDRAVKKLEDEIKKAGGVENITEENMPEAHIRGDVDTPYKCIGGGGVHDAARGLRPGRLHLAAQPAREPVRSYSPMAMQTTSNNTEGEPMMDINTTPLIDVMLVLLIMLIITIPPQTHAVKLDLPQNNPNDVPPPIDPIKNKIVVTAGGADPVERRRGRPDPAQAVPRRDAADRPGARASPPARARCALRAGRRGARGDQEGQCHQDGVRRQRSLYEGLLTLQAFETIKGGPRGAALFISLFARSNAQPGDLRGKFGGGVIELEHTAIGYAWLGDEAWRIGVQ